MAGFTLTFGAYAEPSFVGMKAIITRSAPQVDGSGNVSPVTWTVTIAGDGTGSVSGLPYNDDGTTYRCVWQALSYKPSPGNKVFQVLAAQGATIDYDTIANADGTTTPAVSPQVPLVTSVNGHAGAVSLSASDVGADASGAATAAQAAAVAAIPSMATIAADPTIKAALVPGSVYANDRSTIVTTKRLHVVLTADGTDIDDLIIETVS